ncbi:uncharacterized protein LOC111301062 [Durio zibethinus]|uniref:Uncharacterized protein LOC111301062 n=1 Tax=Durio zibethinus TaxID=66656 RepID=A0A6P5ZID8_DURZI|nr:uncharacterized protein LOC111301062 [Durio zibethinus]
MVFPIFLWSLSQTKHSFQTLKPKPNLAHQPPNNHKWATLHHLNLRHVARCILKQLQPHAAAFHPTQALIAAAIGSYVIEFDALTGSKLSPIDIGSPVVRMSYSLQVSTLSLLSLRKLQGCRKSKAQGRKR